jgi:hypothetical protein
MVSRLREEMAIRESGHLLEELIAKLAGWQGGKVAK